MLLPIEWIVLVIVCLGLSPGLRDMLAQVFGTVYDDVTYYGPIVKSWVKWILVIYLAAIMVVFVFGAFALANGNTEIFAAFCLVGTLMVMPFNSLINKVTNVANAVLPDQLRIGTPKATTVLILINLICAETALLFPESFYSWYGIFLLALMIVGLGVMTAWPSDMFMARSVLGGILVVTFALGCLWAVIPTDMESVQIWNSLRSAAKGRDNIVSKLSERPIEKVVAETGVYTIETNFFGSPKKGKDGLVKFKKTDEIWVAGKEFKTLDTDAKSEDAGELLVRAYPKNADGTWVQTDDASNKWIVVSRTTLASLHSGGSDQVQSTSSSSTGNLVASGKVPVAECATEIGTFTGKIIIELSGTAKLDSTREDFGPRGWTSGGPAPAFFALPGAPMFSAIASVGGKKMFVGDRIELNLSKPTKIYLGPNEEPGKDGRGYKDNKGEWLFRVLKV